MSLRRTPWTTVLRNAWNGIAPIDTLTASPLDKPNTVLILHDDCPVRLTHWGVPREGLACVFLYVDRPDALAAALRRSANCNY
jgi:hypothetical protein